MSAQALRANPLRSTLSLLGMTLGVFSIIFVLSVVDSLERSVRSSIESVGSDVLYIQKWPWGGSGGEYPWWKYFQRPEPKYEEMAKIQDRITTEGAMSFLVNISANLNYENNTVDNVGVMGVSHAYLDIWPTPMAEGRYFSPQESGSGRNVAVVGSDVAEGLFGSINPIGKRIRILGEKVRIIGVFEKEGEKLIGESQDQLVLLPVEFMLRKVNEDELQTTIMVKAREGVPVERLQDDVEGAMRGIRRLRPRAENNFAINEISVLQNSTEAIFSGLGMIGLIIGGFALLAGGFGIANIMFVSVSERVGQIGIQKALGSRRNFILYQFLAESVLLSLLGGIIGLLVTGGLVWIARSASGFELMLSGGNITTGIVISVLIGLIFGLIPAIKASGMNPVEAIRAGN